MNRKIIVMIAIVVLMAALSSGFFLLQNILFGKPGDTGFYLLQDLAFLPINVLLVTLGVNAFIGYREKLEKLNRTNILVSEFFVESGFDAIRMLNPYILNLEDVDACAGADRSCGKMEFKRFVRAMEKMEVKADAGRGDLASLRDGLLRLKPNLLSMFENPNLLEHDRFTDMLWALYHLMDELRSRNGFADLPGADKKHLSGDITRAYSLLVVEWAYIVRHMKERYPYLYSMASRKNPFLPGNVIINEE